MLVGLLLALPAGARAAEIQGAVVCDNYHFVFTGSVDGRSLTPRGRVEVGPQTTPVRYSFQDADDEYVYIAAWSDRSIEQGLLHGFTVDGVPRYSAEDNKSAWEVCATGFHKDGPLSNPIRDLDLAGWIRECNAGATPSAGWVKPGASPNGLAIGDANDGTFPDNAPWCAGSPCADIPESAQWTWYDSGECGDGAPAPFFPGCDHYETLIFRLSPVR